MNEADHGMTDMAMNNGRYHADAQLLVKFYTAPKHLLAESEVAGRPIYKDAVFISIRVPGAKDETIKPVNNLLKQRFPEHWAKFEARESQEVVGTPLSEWPMVTRSQVEEMRFMAITTVEQLASVSDTNSQGIMGIGILKTKAAAYLERAEKEASGILMESKLAERDEQIASLLARVEAMEAETPEKPKRTRRTKAEMEAASQE